MAVWCPNCKVPLYKLTEELYECRKCHGLFQLYVKKIGQLLRDSEFLKVVVEEEPKP